MANLADLVIGLTVDGGQAMRQAREAANRVDRSLSGIKGFASANAKALSLGPALAPGIVAAGALVGALASAGAAVGAFTAAAKPQFAKVTASADLYTAAMAAQAKGGEEAKTAMAAYKDSLKSMDPATRATAKSFIGLKSDYQSWSDSLASNTMPVFTKAIDGMRASLPMLTPFVKDASATFSSFLDTLGKDVKSDGFKEFVGKLQATAKEVLPNLLKAIKNVAKGFGGIIEAFLPASGKVTGGLVTLTDKFAQFGQGMGDNPMFAKFKELAGASGGALMKLAEVASRLALDLAPVLGITTELAIKFAELVEKIPTSVLEKLAIVIGVVKAGMILWNVVSAITSGVTTAWAAAQAALNFVMAMNPVLLIVLAILALIAVIVVIATKTTWFQQAWSFAWNLIKAVANAVWNWIKSTLSGLWDWMKGIWSTSLEWIKSKWNAAWNWVKSVLSTVWAAIKAVIQYGIGQVKAVIGGIKSVISTITNAFQRAKDGVVSKVGALLTFVKSIPGRVKSGLGNLGSLLLGAGKAIVQGLINGVRGMIGSLKSQFNSITGMIPDWKGPMSLDLKLLTPSGEALMSGLMGGIDKTVPALRDQLQGVTSDIPNNINVGVRTAGRSAAGEASASTVVLDVTGGNREMRNLIRKMVRVDSRGSVQLAFGTR